LGFLGDSRRVLRNVPDKGNKFLLLGDYILIPGEVCLVETYPGGDKRYNRCAQ